MHSFLNPVPAALIIFAMTGMAQSRETSPLDSGWRFKIGEVSHASGTAFDDRNWETVSLPHNWGWETAARGESYYRGPGWYRRALDIGTPTPGKRYFVRFGAAGSVADVYLNDTLIGQHRGAFGAFCFEITKHLTQNGSNTLAVHVTNAPQPDIAPLSGDFNVFGGLYRDAQLITTNEICFSLTDHASPGVAWLQSKVTDRLAELDIVAQISGGPERVEQSTLSAYVLDHSGQKMAATEQRAVITPTVTAPYRMHLVLPHPHLWNGTRDPYLYRAVVELRGRDGNVIDAVEQPLGIRFFRVEPEKGFFLNGKPYHLHGVNRHQDRPDKGWAITDADMREDLALILDLGCTAVRCAHYQHSDYFYTLCDSVGLLVWAELPQVDEIGAGPQFAETSRSQLLDLIRQNINHPSIFAWSLFNELWPGRTDPHRELQDLTIVANGEDPTRPTIAATASDRWPQMNKIPDLLGWNIYPGWYPGWGTKDSAGAILDRFRLTSRSGGFCVSEYGAGANVEHHEQNPKQPVTDGQWHPEEWQALVHESVWAAIKDRPFVWGSFVWNMFDFISAARHEGGIPGRNDKGLVTGDRKTRKDAFYFYRANWSAQPTLYIAGRRFTHRTSASTDIKVYSNATEVQLFLNGRSLGSVMPGKSCVFTRKDVTLSPGPNRIEAKAVMRGKAVTDSCEWILNDGH